MGIHQVAKFGPNSITFVDRRGRIIVLICFIRCKGEDLESSCKQHEIIHTI